jgi:hypothetical protein
LLKLVVKLNLFIILHHKHKTKTMKKILFTALIVGATLGMNAQEIKSSKNEIYLPEAKDWAIGFNADGIFRYVGNSFNGNTNNGAPKVDYVNDRVGTFVGKKFIDSKTAYRVIANLAIGSNTNTGNSFVPVGFPNTIRSIETSNTGFDLTAGLGKEFRRGRTRLQGFYGADLLLKLNKTSDNVKTSDVTTTGSTITTANSDVETSNGFGFGIGAQGFIGAEYFLFPKIAIGAQYTYGVSLDFKGKGKQTITTSASGTAGTSSSSDLGSSSNIAVGGVGITSINITLHF